MFSCRYEHNNFYKLRRGQTKGEKESISHARESSARALLFRRSFRRNSRHGSFQAQNAEKILRGDEYFRSALANRLACFHCIQVFIVGLRRIL